MPEPESKPPTPLRTLGRILFYTTILLAVVILHLRGGLAIPPFIYQGF